MRARSRRWLKAKKNEPVQTVCFFSNRALFDTRERAHKEARRLTRKFGAIYDPCLCKPCGGWHLQIRKETTNAE